MEKFSKPQREKIYHETPWMELKAETNARDIWKAARKKYQDTQYITDLKREWLIDKHAIHLARKVLELRHQEQGTASRPTGSDISRFLGKVQNFAYQHTVYYELDLDRWARSSPDNKHRLVEEAFQACLEKGVASPTVGRLARELCLPYAMLNAYLNHVSEAFNTELRARGLAVKEKHNESDYTVAIEELKAAGKEVNLQNIADIFRISPGAVKKFFATRKHRSLAKKYGID